MPLSSLPDLTQTFDTPLIKLTGILTAALRPAAADYRLDLSILLHGQRGIGKVTVTRQAARKLGLHVLEVCVTVSMMQHNLASPD